MFPEHPNSRTLERSNAFSSISEACLTSTRVLAAYYFWYFAAIGVYEPYITPFWQHLGFSPVQLGLLNAISPGIAVFAPFLWTAFGDATRRGEEISLVNTWVSALVALWIANLSGLAPMALAVLIFAVFRTPLIPLANSMAFHALAGRPQGFAGIRLWGTIGYILTAVVAGAVVDRIGLRAGMHGIALAMLACGVIAWMGRSRRRASLPPARLGAFLETLRDRRFVLLLAAASLARMSFGPYTTFFTIHLKRLGLSSAFAGTAWALAAVSELVVMICWSRISPLASLRVWMTLGLGAHPLRWHLSIAAGDPVALLLIQLTHAFTFGVFYLAAVQSVDMLVPEGLRATAQGVFASVVFGLSTLLGNAVSGFLYEPLGMAWLYAAAAALASAGTILYWAGMRPPVAAGHIPEGSPR
ncbi:MAG: MFS transporter [candidate division NC10 bacterium]|nr:MFS transporter [candidate division NC10 bacterium]